jgi:hypothetical protein
LNSCLSSYLADLIVRNEIAALNSANGPTADAWRGRKGPVMAHCRMRFTAAAAAVAILLSAIACTPLISANEAEIQLTQLNVAVVPAVDSAGFFIALYEGLFLAQGLSVHFIPAVSSETVIDLQAEQLPTSNPLDISCGAYPSYITAQEAWDAGQRPSPRTPDIVRAADRPARR